jgi:hypothetical protein
MTARVWTFQQFRSASGRDSILDWRKGLSPARKATFDIFMDRIAKMKSWPSGMCDPIKGHSGFWELRWTAEKVEHRIFGYYGGSSVFVMLIGCTHKGKIYDPPSAFQTMEDRSGKLKAGEGTLSTYELVNVGGVDE